MLGFSAVTTVGALSLPVATASTPAFDPFAPLLSSSGFNFPLDQPLTPSSMLTADINASFLDLLAASSVHVPSPLTFRNPDYQFLPSDFLSQPIQAEVDPRFKLGPERRQWMVEIQREKGMKWPVADDVEKLVAIAASTFVSFSPIAHLPTFDLNSEDIIIGFALATAGASKQSSGHAVVVDSDALLEHALLNKREFYQREFSVRLHAFVLSEVKLTVSREGHPMPARKIQLAVRASPNLPVPKTRGWRTLCASSRYSFLR